MNKFLKPSEVIQQFHCLYNETWKEQVREGNTKASYLEYLEEDEPAASEAFNNYTDELCKDGSIPQWLYDIIEIDSDLDSEMEGFEALIEIIQDYDLEGSIILNAADYA